MEVLPCKAKIPGSATGLVKMQEKASVDCR